MTTLRTRAHSHIRKTPGDVLFTIINGSLLILIAVIMLFPFLNTIAISFNDGNDALRGGIWIWPRIFTTQNYSLIFEIADIPTAFFISVSRTLLGALLSTVTTAMVAYTLTRKEYVFRGVINTMYVLTMYFNAGLIPNYFLIKNLGLLNNFLVYLLPGMISAFNVVIIRTYMSSISESLTESARIDGAGYFTVFSRIIFPLCMPVLATVALFCAVGAWNSWFDTYIYCARSPHLTTLQYELKKLLTQSSQMNASTSNAVAASYAAAGDLSGSAARITPETVRAAITVIASVPILVVYPFLQRYFVTGLTIGGVKE